MSCKYWLLFGSLTLSATQSVACSSKFSSCEARRTCPSGGASGTAGTAGTSTDGGEAGAAEGGAAGSDARGGTAGTADDGGSSGTAGDSNVDTELAIAPPTLTPAKTYVAFSAKIHASGASQYTWSITSGTLPAGLALQGEQSATLTIAGTATEAGQFPITISVTDGSITKSVDVTLVVTHSALFLSDRSAAGVNELFLTEIGGESAAAPVRLSGSLPTGGNVSSYAWSPDGSKVLYLATPVVGGAAELWVASLASPGTAQRVSAVGVSVSQMVWLRAGNVAAYTTSAGDTYLAELSGAIPGGSKLAVTGPGTPSALAPSPNGSSLTVGTSEFESSIGMDLQTVTYVTWSPTVPKAVKIYSRALADSSLTFSYDGRFGFNVNGWWDLSLAAPSYSNLGSTAGYYTSLSPGAQALLISESGSTRTLSVGVFEGGSLKTTVLAQGTACQFFPGPWSPDGNDAVFRCANDVRGIDQVATATVGTDFSLLPSGFLSNAFTDSTTVSWSPDSKWIALRADRDIDSQYDLYVVRWSAPGVAYNAHANSIGAGVTAWVFAPNSRSVAFVGGIAPQSNAGLYLTTLPTTGAPPTAALVSSPLNAVVQADINWLPGSRVITYRATVSDAAQLFAVPVAADGTAGTPVPVSGASGSGVTSYQLAPIR